MKNITFTDEQVKILAQNPYTSLVTPHCIRFTLAFKKAFWSKKQAGERIADIFTDLGYDIDIIGRGRAMNIAARIRKEAMSSIGLHEGNKKHELLPIDNSYNNLSNNDAMIQMQHEIMYLRQEMEFIKKILKSDNSK